MKTKIGTVLEEDILKELKERAAKDGRAISDVIQDALMRYFYATPKETTIRLQTLERLCSRPFRLTPQELGKILDENSFQVSSNSSELA